MDSKHNPLIPENEIKDFLILGIQQWKLLTCAAIIGGILALGTASFFPRYKAKGELSVNNKDSTLQATMGAFSGTLASPFSKNQNIENFQNVLRSDDFLDYLSRGILESTQLASDDRELIEEAYEEYRAGWNDAISKPFDKQQWLPSYLNQKISLTILDETVLAIEFKTRSFTLSQFLTNTYLELAQKYGAKYEQNELLLASKYISEKTEETQQRIIEISQKILSKKESIDLSGSLLKEDYFDTGLFGMRQSLDEAELRTQENISVMTSLKDQPEGSIVSRSLVSTLSTENKILNSKIESLSKSIKEKEKGKEKLLKSIHALQLYSRELEFEIESLKALYEQKIKIDMLSLAVSNRFRVKNLASPLGIKNSIPKALAAIFGAFLALLGVLVFQALNEFLYPKVRSRESLNFVGGEFGGAISFFSKNSATGITDIHKYPLPPTLLNHNGFQIFKSLRSRIENKISAIAQKSGVVISLTSPGPGAGKTVTSSNLAWCMAQSGQKVLLIDSDIFNPQVTKRFKLDSHKGLLELLKNCKFDAQTLFDHVSRYDDNISSENGELHILPRGLLDSTLTSWPETHIEQFLAFARTQYDRIVIDTSPALLIQDCRPFHKESNLILIISEYKKTTVADLSTSLLNLPIRDSKKICHVINKTPRDSFGTSSAIDIHNYYTNYPFKKKAS